MEKRIFCDTNIFIDLCTMRLVGEFFMLPYEIHSTDLVLREIELSNQKETILSVMKMGKLEINQTLPECINDVVNLMKSNLSITDAAVWYHAKQQSALLLTGDNRLRKLAEADNVTSRESFLFWTASSRMTSFPQAMPQNVWNC